MPKRVRAGVGRSEAEFRSRSENIYRRSGFKEWDFNIFALKMSNLFMILMVIKICIFLFISSFSNTYTYNKGVTDGRR